MDFPGERPSTTTSGASSRRLRIASNVKAPTLIMGDVGEPNVPLINSHEWFHALRAAGVPVEFYAYPADSHFPHDIVRTTDVCPPATSKLDEEVSGLVASDFIRY